MAPDRRILMDRLAASPVRLASVARRAVVAEVVVAEGVVAEVVGLAPVVAEGVVAEAVGLAPGGWTARQVVAHLVSVESGIWQARLDQLAAGESPVWAWTEPGPATSPEAATLDGALELFAALRAGTVARVASLDEAGWARAGTHATFGRLDVAALLGVAIDHDEEHLAGLEARAG